LLLIVLAKEMNEARYCKSSMTQTMSNKRYSRNKRRWQNSKEKVHLLITSSPLIQSKSEITNEPIEI
jgi:hypothetical protein